MVRSRTRRDFLVSAGAGAGAVVVGGLINGRPAGAQSTMPDSPATTANREQATGLATDQYTRKSASDLTPEEITRFKAAFQLVIDKGIMSQFATEHYDFMRHWHHGALLNTQSLSAVDAPEPAISRFLSWHRAFLIELENSMQEALEEAGDPNYGKVFLPYWDWSHMDDMPAWTHLELWRPTGVTATAVEGLPKGNPGYGIQGQTYEVELVRWPGTISLASTLPSAEHIELILQEQYYYDFTTYLDFAPMLVVEKSSDKATRLAALIEEQGSPSFMAPLVRSLRPEASIGTIALPAARP